MIHPGDEPERRGFPGLRRLRQGAAVMAPTGLAAGAAIEILSLFPDQGKGLAPMSQDTPTVAAHAVIAVALLITAGLSLLRFRGLADAGAVMAAGIVVASIGLVVSDFAGALATTSAGGGLWLEAVALVVAGIGALVGWPPARSTAAPRPNSDVLILTAIASLLLGVALLPAWDHYALTLTTVREHLSVNAGSAFARQVPVAYTVGDLLTALAFAVLPFAGVLGRRGRARVLLGLGVVAVAASQVVSAVVGIFHPSLALFAPPRQASEFGLVVHASLTAWFDAEVVAALALLLLIAVCWDASSPAELPSEWVTPVPSGSTAHAPAGTIGYGAGASDRM